jgi:hypothetical protein
VYVSVNGATERTRGIPFPGTFIVDRAGRVKARFFEDSYTVRNTVSNIRLKMNASDGTVDATRVQTPQLDVTTYASDAVVAPGNRFSVVTHITPRSGVHVYAPGASNYKIIEMTITPNQYLRPQAVKYPPSEIYFFKPLNERVPTYQKPFTLTQEVVLDGSGATRNALASQTSMAISGTLMYQACDDHLCYDPVRLPLSWTVGLKPMVPQPTVPPAGK